MSGLLIDTNVVSELRKGERANRAVAAWFGGVDDAEIFLSVLVIGEIRRGIESIRRRDARGAHALEGWLGRLIEEHAERVLPVTTAIAEEWGRLDALGSLPVVDGLLAATARVHDLVLVTRNVKDVVRTGVKLINPFSAG